MLSVDLHSHTLFSQCGIHTHVEMLTAARELGLAGLAITDHGPALGGRHPSPVYERLRQPVSGIRYLKGIEANVTDESGAIDAPSWMLPMLDVVLLGLHVRFDRPSGSADWTTALINAMRRNPYVDVITHPVDEQFPIDLGRVAGVARELGIALELNNSKILYRRTTVEAVARFLDICRDAGCLVAVSSDAHVLHEVGDDSSVRPLLEASGIPQARVVNATAESTWRFLETRQACRKAWLAADSH